MGMLWKDFCDQGLECDDCPLKQEDLCPGGWTASPGGTPIEPPCCSFDDDTDLEEWVNSAIDLQFRMEKAENKRLQQKSKRQEAAKKAAETRRAVRWYCRSEISNLTRAKNNLIAFQKSIDFARTFAEAFNTTNEMFRYPERMKEKPENAKAIAQLKEAVEEAQKKYDAKKAEFYQNRKDKQEESK